jgi:uncharacterized 2Fe-2S/4Fe-4S cluster protein (DUF4445 family)
MQPHFRIDFEPLGRRGHALPGQTLLDAARSAGVGLASVCGGAGTCEECRIRLVSGRLTPATLVEEMALSGADLDAGFRLACQASPLSDIKLDIPPESLSAPQRLQLDGQESNFEIHPAIQETGAYGLAVDIGTTKLAAYLVDLSSAQTVARAGEMNPQIAYGEDVISRIAYTGHTPAGAEILRSVLCDSLNEMLSSMCVDANISTASVLDAVLVGNTAMHHLFAGLPVEQLGYAPFAPATTEPLHLLAKDLGLRLGPGATAYLPPVIAGYIGSDHLSMLLAGGSWKTAGNIVALDIGTNTEISLISNGKITSCSCASGPAFEGAHIKDGMRASPGAIERARWSDGRILWQTIGDQPPIGICGSGILDVVAALMDGGLLKPNGTLNPDSGGNYILVPVEETQLERDLLVTRKDIHEIQLAKAAIRSAVEILLGAAGISSSDLDEFIVAGAFGTYLDLRSAIRIGMFPPLPLGKYHQIGNAAGVGARQLLLSTHLRLQAERLARRISYLELASEKNFMENYLRYLRF